MQQYRTVCGVYKITCLRNNQFYIGSSVDTHYRWLRHLSALRRGIHHSQALQQSYIEFGEGSLVFEVIHEMSDSNNVELLRMEECYYIEELHPTFNSAASCTYEQTLVWRNKIAETTKKLYTEKGYVNPRKGTGKQYDVYDISGRLIYQGITMDILETKAEFSYHTSNTMLRKYNGICCSFKLNWLIMEAGKHFEDLIVAYKTTSFNSKCPICDLEGNTYNRGSNYFIKGDKIKGKGITYSQIYKDLMNTENLYINVENKIFTLPYLGHFVQQCISNNT